MRPTLELIKSVLKCPVFTFHFADEASEKSDSSKGTASAKDETNLLVTFILTWIILRLTLRLLRHSTTSFSGNVVVAETSYHFATGRGLNLLSSIKSTVPTFLVKKKSSPMKLPEVSFSSSNLNVSDVFLTFN